MTKQQLHDWIMGYIIDECVLIDNYDVRASYLADKIIETFEKAGYRKVEDNVDLPELDETNRDILEISREYKAAKENGDEKKMRDLEKYVSDTYGAPIDRVLFDARVLEEELK